jgi:aminopeptidase-like protein
VHYVKRIAKADQSERRNELLDILRSENIPFTHHHQKHNDNWVENIVVSLNPSDRRLVIGAHYDSFKGSSGANDNASGVSVLIRLAKALLEREDSISADLVFFDREEYVNRGSEKYIDFIGKEKLTAMINLDVCGNGENVCVSAKDNEKNDAFLSIFSPPVLQKHKVNLMGYLPNGDDSSFDYAGVPNISIAMLSDNDVAAFHNFYENYIKKEIEPTQEENEKLLASIEVISTMHNGPNDSIESVNQDSIDTLLAYLCNGLANNV